MTAKEKVLKIQPHAELIKTTMYYQIFIDGRKISQQIHESWAGAAAHRKLTTNKGKGK